MFSHRIHKTIIQINVCVCVLKVTCVIIMLYKKKKKTLPSREK